VNRSLRRSSTALLRPGPLSCFLLITVPVFGQHEYTTHARVGDLEREGAEYLIVGDRDDQPKTSNERVIAPGENLGCGQRPWIPTCVPAGRLPRNDTNSDTRM
jgi:hypothetical protein